MYPALALTGYARPEDRMNLAAKVEIVGARAQLANVRLDGLARMLRGGEDARRSSGHRRGVRRALYRIGAGKLPSLHDAQLSVGAGILAVIGSLQGTGALTVAGRRHPRARSKRS